MKGTIVVAGSIAQRARCGGHAWVFLQHALGLRQLGWDVVLVDRLDPGMAVDARGRACPVADSVNLRYLLELVDRFGLHDRFALLHPGGSLGLSRRELLRRLRESVLLLNVMGFLDDEELLAAAPRRAFLDIDPGIPQLWRQLGLADVLAGHDAFVTVGERIGSAGCPIPTCGLDWITTPQPIVLEQWPAMAPEDGPFTSVCAWRGPFAPLEWNGRTYGQRVHEFRKFVALPRLSRASFRLALDIHPAEGRDLALLADNGWSLVDPGVVAGDPIAYRAFIHASAAEIMVAKSLYVEGASGWFSDRSICYLASGRPVLAQDTGFSYPTGAGLLSFSTLDEAVAGVEAIRSDPARHARAARELAESYFRSDLVLTRLLERLNVG